MAQVELFMTHKAGRLAHYKITTSTWREYDGLRRITLAKRAIEMPNEVRTFRSPPGSASPKKLEPAVERCLFCGLAITNGDHAKCVPEGFGDAARKRRWPWRK